MVTSGDHLPSIGNGIVRKDWTRVNFANLSGKIPRAEVQSLANSTAGQSSIADEAAEESGYSADHLRRLGERELCLVFLRPDKLQVVQYVTA
jgi:hypothetical protein